LRGEKIDIIPYSEDTVTFAQKALSPAKVTRVQIIDPETLELVPDGAEGELVLTTLSKQAMPMIRYRTRDITAFATEPCACGRTIRRIRRQRLRKPCRPAGANNLRPRGQKVVVQRVRLPRLCCLPLSLIPLRPNRVNGQDRVRRGGRPQPACNFGNRSHRIQPPSLNLGAFLGAFLLHAFDLSTGSDAALCAGLGPRHGTRRKRPVLPRRVCTAMRLAGSSASAIRAA
jgi:hypothetical protein